jgi:serine/threonine-protein kinase
MEHVDGLGLDKVLAQGERFAPSAAVHVILQVLDALACAHAVGIVHRDIKPANILLMTGGRVKVTDFGVARLDSSDLTLDGMVIGSPSYMSPEQCLGDAVDQRSDLFCAAVVLQEMLIGDRPFPGRNLTEIAFRVLRDAPDGGAALEAIAGSGVKSVLHRALAKSADDRFASASQMADALREAMGETAPPSALAAAVDQTVVAVSARRLAPQPSVGTTFDQALLSQIERRLAHRLGPIARYLVQTAIRNAASVEELCNVLAQRIDHPDERKLFLSEALEAVGVGATGKSPASSTQSQSPPQPQPQSPSQSQSSIPPGEVERARRALAETLGPIAKILVQRALPKARTSQELWDLLAIHITPAAARAGFLERRDRG